MRRIAVMYTTRYGTTRTYAEWIAQAVAADLFPARGKREDFEAYDTIVYGGYRHGLSVAGLDYIMKNFDALNGKRVIIFCVGVAAVRRETLQAVLDANFQPAVRRQIQIFGLRGAINHRRLRSQDKVKLSLIRMKLKFKNVDKMTEEDLGLLEASEHPVNFLDEKTIAPIVKAILSQGQAVKVADVSAERTAPAEAEPTGVMRTPARRKTPVERKAPAARRRPGKRSAPARKAARSSRKTARKKTIIAKKRPAKKAAVKRSVKKAARKRVAVQRPARKTTRKKTIVSKKKTLKRKKRPVRKITVRRSAKKRVVKKAAARRRPAKKAARSRKGRRNVGRRTVRKSAPRRKKPGMKKRPVRTPARRVKATKRVTRKAKTRLRWR